MRTSSDVTSDGLPLINAINEAILLYPVPGMKIIMIIGEDGKTASIHNNQGYTDAELVEVFRNTIKNMAERN